MMVLGIDCFFGGTIGVYWVLDRNAVFPYCHVMQRRVVGDAYDGLRTAPTTALVKIRLIADQVK